MLKKLFNLIMMVQILNFTPYQAEVTSSQETMIAGCPCNKGKKKGNDEKSNQHLLEPARDLVIG